MSMFSKVKDKKQKETLRSLLTFIVEATRGAAGHAMIPKASVEQLLKYEPSFVKIQGDGTPDPAGNVPVFATSEGVTASGTPVAAKVATTPSQFEIESGYEVPEPSKRGGLKGDTYPFETLKVGESFFIAATDDNPKPAKGMASTVSSANKRYVATFPATTGKDKKPHPQAGQPTGKDGRKFTVRDVVDPKKGAGARIWRIA